MAGVLAAFGRRPVAAVGLADFVWRGVAGVVAAVWLVERAGS